MASGKRGRRDAERSREKILTAASELFSSKGYAAAGVDELAIRSGIAKTAMYYHFGSKEGLLAAVLERVADEWIERIKAVSYEVNDPVERLDRALAGLRAMVEERPWILRLFQLMALEVAEHKPEIRQRLQAVGDRAREALAGGFRDAISMPLADANGVAQIVLGLVSAIACGQPIEQIPVAEAFAEVRSLAMLMLAARLHPERIAEAEAELHAHARDRSNSLRCGEESPHRLHDPTT